jgi:hypothetical protein
MQLYRLIYYSQSALHVSGDEMDELERSSNSYMTPAGNDICEHYQKL